jgi:large subunit ribosomal protein L15
MMIHEITALVGKEKARKRIGRGRGSGRGKTSGRGHKGAGSRAGNSRKGAFEGGQMPYFRRLPKRGFTNAKFMTQFWIANLRDIVEHPNFAKGGEVSTETLMNAGLIRDAKRPLKILGDLGEADKLSVKLDIKAERVTASARKHVEAAGGTVTESGTRRDRVRGVDRSSGDYTPTNLTKKLKRVRKGEKRREEFAAKALTISGKNKSGGEPKDDKGAKGKKKSKK